MKELYHYNNFKRTTGPHRNLINTYNIWGDCTRIHGDAQNLTGDVTSLHGDISGLSGNATYCYSPDDSLYIGDVANGPATTVEIT
jgi:hypothetical protein